MVKYNPAVDGSIPPHLIGVSMSRNSEDEYNNAMSSEDVATIIADLKNFSN